MSDRLISALTVLTTPAGDDYLPIIDISEGVGTSKNKRITIDDLFRSIPNANVQPNWTGKLNGWPDPFFRKVTSANATALYGRNRWYNPFASWTLVDNTIFDGKALRRDVTATIGPLNGPAIWFDDIGATVGSQVTVCALVTGNGAAVSLFGRPHSRATNPGPISGDRAQQSLRTKEGAGTITTTSSPQFVSLTITVEGTETGIGIYSQHTPNTLYYDIVALWAFKGTLVSGLDWPNLGDEIRAEATSNTAITSTNTANIATNTANLAYATISVTDVTYASGTTTLNGTGFTTVPRDSPFTGWGEVYTPSGVSFNAIQVASLTRTAVLETSKWRTLYAVVKTAGSASAAPSGTVVAVGSVTVNPGNDTLTDETILLRNPSTNALITLTNTDFSSHYFIGIYARNASDARASCGEPLGTMPNTAGQSYYLTSSDPLGAGASWLTYTQNLRLGFRHLLLTSPAETTGYEPTSEFVNDIQAQFPVDSADYVPTLVVPPTIYAVQGREVNIYFDNLVLEDISRYNVDVTTSGSLGDHQNERWTWVPSGELPSGLVSITLHDKGTSTQLASASTIRRAAGSGWGSGLTKKVMMIGDSLTNDATITQTLLDIDATDVMSITLYGTRGTAPNRHEGRGGWTVTSYTSATHVDSTPNPFWRASGTPAVDFGWYLTQNAYPAMDWVLIQLGTNDVFSATSDGAAVSAAQAAFIRMDTLITSIKASDANTKVGLVIAPPPSFDQDSFGANYGAGQTRWRFKRNILIWARDLIARYQGRESPDRIFIVPSNTALDTVNNMSRASSAPVNSRSAVTSTRQNNGVHPATSGYQQIADAIWAFLKYQA
jgi:lysophospholipase L1-like esterase